MIRRTLRIAIFVTITWIPIAGCGSVGSKPNPPGCHCAIITGGIRLSGGPVGPPGVQGYVSGEVKLVYNGNTVAKTTTRDSQSFTFAVDPGTYDVVARNGNADCHAGSVTAVANKTVTYVAICSVK